MAFLLLYSERVNSFSIYQQKSPSLREELLLFVGVARFELTTSCSQSRRDTGLRYTPNFLKKILRVQIYDYFNSLKKTLHFS